MKRRIVRYGGAALGLLLLAGLLVPYLNADRYGERLKWSLQRSLGRPVDIGKVRFTLLNGPAFSVERDENGPGVVIHEDPTIGIEPVAYVESMRVRPAFWPLLTGRFVIASIRLEDASINLSKTGPASEPGVWNFTSFVNPSVMRTAPAIHIRNGRIHFKFGETKSVFYLTETDLDISPPSARGAGWSVWCSAKPARSDRTAQGLGSFSLSGRWYVAPERVDLDLVLDRTGVGELTALIRGQAGSIHGTLSSRLHLGGPIQNIGIAGRLNVEDVHRWDLLPPHGQGWPLDVRGRLDLIRQQFELQSSSAGGEALPLTARFRVSDYLSKPRWAVAVNWNRFPVDPVMQLATDMGAQFPPKLKFTGTIDGAIGYSGEGSFQGELGLHNSAVTIPDSPPVRFEEAYFIVDHGHVRLSPARVLTSEQDEAQVEADYAIGANTFDLTIHTEAMKVASLRAQVALTAVPWLEQVESGQWSGDLHYRYGPPKSGWTGQLSLTDARIPVAGLAHPLEVTSARAQIDGARVLLDHLEAKAGEIAFTGEYRYEPTAPRPHRLRLKFDQLDAADLEKELSPTLRRSSSLLARALGRSGLPEWLKSRGVDGTLEIRDLLLDATHVEGVRGRLVWDTARVELQNVQARLGRAAIAGRLAVSLRNERPSYQFTGKVKGLTWQSGKVDAEGTLETSGTGRQLLANLKSEGTFTGSALDFGTSPPWKAVSGRYTMSWSPRLSLTDLNLKMEDEVFTGKGAVQDDGRVLIQLSNGTKEMRMTGTLAHLRIEDTRP
jgi:hypothetical protein